MVIVSETLMHTVIINTNRNYDYDICNQQIIYEVFVCQNDKATKQHIFIIENNIQKVGESFFHLSRRTTMIQDLLVRRQFSR